MYSPEKTRCFLEALCKEKGRTPAAVLKIITESDRLHVVSLLEDGVYPIDWIFNRSFWLRGYADVSCAALIQYGFCEMEIHKTKFPYLIQQNETQMAA